jgi:hypothetical protein
MKLIEGRLGDPSKTYPWFTFLEDRVYIGDALDGSYTYTALLRGFQVIFAGGASRNLREIEVGLENFYSVDNPGYLYVKATVKLRDNSPGGWNLFGLTFKGDEEVSFLVDYTIAIIYPEDRLHGV